MKRAGFTLIELLISMAILAVILGTLASYLISSQRTARTTQNLATAQDKVRAVSQVVLQDLQVTGSSLYADPDATHPTATTVPNWTSCSSAACLTGTDGGAQDTLSLRYVTSLQPTSTACRSVGYSFSGNTLRRSDVPCGTSASPQDLAAGVLALDMVYVCSDGSEVQTPSCGVGKYVRSARFSVYAASDKQLSGTPAAAFTTASGRSVACLSGYRCYGETLETSVLNLKDK